MEYPVAAYHLVDDQLYQKDEFDPNFLFSGKSIYEVVSIKNGTPIFLEEHFDRFQESARLLNIDFPFKLALLKNRIKFLVEKNQLKEGNLKLLYKYKEGNCFLPIMVSYFIAGSEVSDVDYTNGVHVESVEMMRYNPNIKQTDKKLREFANERIAKRQVNEVILLDSEGFITEGSRSNVFFLKGKSLCTPPGNQILKGITRDYVKKISAELEIEFKEVKIHISELDDYDHCIISSTSRGILPVTKFDAIICQPPNEIIQAFLRRYNEIIEEYIMKSS